MTTKQIYKLLKSNDRKVKVTVSSRKRAQFRLYARVLAQKGK